MIPSVALHLRSSFDRGAPVIERAPVVVQVAAGGGGGGGGASAAALAEANRGAQVQAQGSSFWWHIQDHLNRNVAAFAPDAGKYWRERAIAIRDNIGKLVDPRWDSMKANLREVIAKAGV